MKNETGHSSLLTTTADATPSKLQGNFQNNYFKRNFTTRFIKNIIQGLLFKFVSILIYLFYLSSRNGYYLLSDYILLGKK